MTRIVCLGECTIELKQAQGGLYSRAFVGDALNTAVYLARLGMSVDFVTALGDDALSEEMIGGWAEEGIGTKRVVRLAGKLPGICMIQTGEAERRSVHWQENSAARSLMDLPETEDILNSLPTYDAVCLSGVSLSLYDANGRARLMAALKRAKLLGTRAVFDANFRMHAWPDLNIARGVYNQAFAAADIVLVSIRDLLPLYPGAGHATLLEGISSPEVVLRLSDPASIVRFEGISHEVKAEPVRKPVVDPTGAGDSFAAAYVAARLSGSDPVAAARAGHRLAGVVICYPGAIIPRYAMPLRKARPPTGLA